MVGPELGRETDAIAESVLLIIWSAQKVVQPKPDQPDRRRRHCGVVRFFVPECTITALRGASVFEYRSTSHVQPY